MKTVLLNLLVVSLIYAQNTFVLNGDDFELDVQVNTPILLNFPFKVSDSKQYCGEEECIAEKNRNTIMITLYKLPATIIAFGEEEDDAVYINFISSELKKKKSVFNFRDAVNTNPSEEENSDSIDSLIVSVFSKINSNGDINLPKSWIQRKYKKSKKIFKNKKLSEISFEKVDKYCSSTHCVIKYNIKNINKNPVDIRNIRQLFVMKNKIANSFDENILLPGEHTYSYYLLKKEK